jgi:1,4-dihydroxy-2-naphthoate octaprenyltransferase
MGQLGHCVIFTKIHLFFGLLLFLGGSAEETPSSAIKYHGLGDVITSLFCSPLFVFGHFLLLRARFKESATTSDKDIVRIRGRVI